MKQNDFFVAMPNKMFAFDTEFFATDDEFLLFYHLGTLVQARNTSLIIANIELLTSELCSNDTNTSRAKAETKNALFGLQEKGYISINYRESNITYTTYLHITLADLQNNVYTEPVKSGSWEYRGFTGVTDKDFNKTSTAKELKIITYVLWRSQIKYDISYYEWEKILGVSYSTAVKHIQDCHRNGLIVKQRGDYYTTSSGEIRQETNSYKIKKNVDDDNEVDYNKAFNTLSKSMKRESMSKETRKNNWFKTGSKKETRLDENDFYIYQTTKCDVLREQALNRINGLKNTKGGSKLVQYLTKKAKETISLEQRKKCSDIHELVQLEDMLEERPIVYKKQDTEDYSYMFDDEDIEYKDELDDLPMFD